MKTLCAFAAFAIAIGSFSTSRAQSGMALENWKDILVGPMFTAGASVNAGPVAKDWKTSPLFAFTGGAMLTYPWSPQIALDLTVGYDSRGVNFHNQSVDTGGFDLHFSYLIIRPEFRIGGLILGLGFGLPISVSTSYASGGTTQGGRTTSDMNFMIEGRLGGDIPIYTTDASQVHFLIGGSYGFSRIFTDVATGVDNTKSNGPIATLQLGLTYLFDLTPH